MSENTFDLLLCLCYFCNMTPEMFGWVLGLLVAWCDAVSPACDHSSGPSSFKVFVVCSSVAAAGFYMGGACVTWRNLDPRESVFWRLAVAVFWPIWPRCMAESEEQ